MSLRIVASSWCSGELCWPDTTTPSPKPATSRIAPPTMVADFMCLPWPIQCAIPGEQRLQQLASARAPGVGVNDQVKRSRHLVHEQGGVAEHHRDARVGRPPAKGRAHRLARGAIGGKADDV